MTPRAVTTIAQATQKFRPHVRQMPGEPIQNHLPSGSLKRYWSLHIGDKHPPQIHSGLLFKERRLDHPPVAR